MNETYMKEAIRLAKNGTGRVNPNPLVGAVIVKNGSIIARGFHEKFASAHAEVNAINSTKECLEGTTMYVTLEPCSHFGKTPPCVDLIIEHRISEVIVGILDPNPLVAGEGIKNLRAHGIKVTVNVLEEEIREMNRYFLKYITTKTPFVVMKTAMTFDGKIATKTGDSKWVSCESSRELVHQLRHEMMGIMVGIGTVLSDNPSLTTRLKNHKGLNPRPIIIDSTGRFPLDAKMINEHQPGHIILVTTKSLNSEKEAAFIRSGIKIIKTPLYSGRVNLNILMIELGKLGMDSILLEGGQTLNASAIEQGIVDEVISFIAPKIVGGKTGYTPVGGIGVTYMKDAYKLEFLDVQRIGQDVMIRSKVLR